MVESTPVSKQLVGLLPVAGRDGTLKEQLLGTPAEGWMQAKTGTLTDVKALTGEQPASDGRPLDFSLVLNAPGADDAATYQPVWNALTNVIHAYPVVVAPDESKFGAELKPHEVSKWARTIGYGRHADVPTRDGVAPRRRAPAARVRAAYRQMVHDILADDVEGPSSVS